MNKQKEGGIEWTDATWNPITGCLHGCQWLMPDGKIANCYAEDVAEGLASAAYPEGFAHHYFHEKRLGEPFRHKYPMKIFVCSMADLFGAWVPPTQILDVLNVMARTPQHTYQLLTKNLVRVRQFIDDLPDNVWIGASMPPTFMFSHELDVNQQMKMLGRQLKTFAELRNDDYDRILWMSLEPLSWNITLQLQQAYEEYDLILDWFVIGAASNGKVKYQPFWDDAQQVTMFADRHSIPIFHKNNLDTHGLGLGYRRIEFPVFE